jgi:hypothetical protein
MSTGVPVTTKRPDSLGATPRARRSSNALSRAWRTFLGGVRRIPRSGRVCFLIAFVNAAIWGVVVPPFQVPDEITHFAYAQYLAETGKPPPQRAGSPYSPQEQVALDNLFFFNVIGFPQIRGIIADSDDRALRAALSHHPSPVPNGGGNPQANQPPLYYALEAIPYWLSPSHDILTRLALMRLLSALMAAGTVLIVFMFLRELFPATAWAWTVGALVVAFQPMFDFIAAGVQSDNLLYLTSALIFFVLLRAYRHGLTRRRAVAIGAVTAAGMLTKLTFIGLLPGITLALLVLVWRASARDRQGSIQMLAIAAAVAAIPVMVYAGLNVTLWDRGVAAGGLAVVNANTVPSGQVISLRETLSYTWQLYLPRLPFMHSYFPGRHPLLNIWLDGAIGRFGWVDYSLPAWVYTLGRFLLAGFVALALAGIFRLRARLRPVLPIVACFAVMVVGLLGEIGYTGIRYRLSTGFQFEQARYLFPMLALYGAFIVLVARGAGRRWAPALGAALVVLAMAHGLLAETLTISRYYG